VSGSLATHAVLAAFAFVFGIEAELQQRIGVLAAHHHHIAAAAAIAAAGSAARNEFLPAEGKATVTAVAGLYVNSYFVNKHRKAAGVHSCRRLVRTKGELCAGLDVDELAHATAVAELDDASDLGEESVVLTPADIDARLQLGAALAHDDAAARNQLAAENFHAQALRIGIAPVL